MTGGLEVKLLFFFFLVLIDVAEHCLHRVVFFTLLRMTRSLSKQCLFQEKINLREQIPIRGPHPMEITVRLLLVRCHTA